MSLSWFDAGVSSALVVEALRRDGAAIVHNLASATLVDAVTAELRVKLDESGTDHQASYPTGFSGRKTLRCYGVLRFSPSSSELIAHLPSATTAARVELRVGEALVLRGRGTLHSWRALGGEERRILTAIGFKRRVD